MSASTLARGPVKGTIFWVVFLSLVSLAFAPLPGAEATHQWGHRYMIFGRILDVNGTPAQQLPLEVMVDTKLPSDPSIPIATDCFGLYYTLNNQLSPEEASQRGLEGGVLHIHDFDLVKDGRWHVRTAYGEESGRVRALMHRTTANFQLDDAIPAGQSCTGEEDWTTTYVVTGRVQEDRGSKRADLMTLPDQGIEIDVDVRIETAGGVENMTVQTNRFGDYFAIFDNVSVADGDKVTATYDGHKSTDTVDTEYRVSEANILVESEFGKNAVRVLLWVIGAVVVIGGAVWGYTTIRDRMEHKRLQETGVRKRANK